MELSNATKILKHIWQLLLTQLERDNTLILGDSATPLTTMDRSMTENKELVIINY